MRHQRGIVPAASEPYAARARPGSGDLGMRYDGVPGRLAEVGHRRPGQLGTAGYLFETPKKRALSEYWDLVWNDKLVEAMDYAQESGLDQFELDMRGWFTRYPGRPDYFTHWGGAFKYAASVIGLPVGSYPESRPPQAKLPEQARIDIRAAYRRFGLIDD